MSSDLIGTINHFANGVRDYVCGTTDDAPPIIGPAVVGGAGYLAARLFTAINPISSGFSCTVFTLVDSSIEPILKRIPHMPIQSAKGLSFCAAYACTAGLVYSLGLPINPMQILWMEVAAKVTAVSTLGLLAGMTNVD